MASHAAWSETEAIAIVDARAAEKGAMLPILHDLQARFGYIDDAAIPIIASALNVSKAETVGVISFYHDFHRDAARGIGSKTLPSRILSGGRLRGSGRPSRGPPRAGPQRA